MNIIVKIINKKFNKFRANIIIIESVCNPKRYKYHDCDQWTRKYFICKRCKNIVCSMGTTFTRNKCVNCANIRNYNCDCDDIYMCAICAKNILYLCEHGNNIGSFAKYNKYDYAHIFMICEECNKQKFQK